MLLRPVGASWRPKRAPAPPLHPDPSQPIAPAKRAAGQGAWQLFAACRRACVEPGDGRMVSTKHESSSTFLVASDKAQVGAAR